MTDWLRKTFRIINWLPKYNTRQLNGDLSAGLTTGIMLIPQGMAYAVIAGVPPIYGLYAATIPLLVYPLLGTSRHLSVGPVALDMLIVSAGVGALASQNASEFVLLAVILTLLTGLLQMLMGVLHLGFIFNFFSRPVISGFTIAAPIIIMNSQIGSLLGLNVSRDEFILAYLTDIITHIDMLHWPTFIMGMSAILILTLLSYFKPKFPGSVVIVAISIAIAYYYDAESIGIALTGSIPSGLPGFEFPQLTIERIQDLTTTAITLSLVQFMGVASLSKVFAKRHNYVVDPNHELIAIGASNVAGSFFHAIPVSGSFSRTAASEQAGAQTPMANVITALTIILTLSFLTPVFYYLPEPILAAVIVVSVFSLIDINEFIFLYKTKRSEGMVAMITFLSTLLIGIQEGILLGVATSMIAILYKISRPNVAEVGLIPDTQAFQDLERKPEAKRIEGIMVLRVDASFSFVNADYFKEYILRKTKERNTETHHVVLDGSAINDLDITAIDALKSIARTLDKWNIQLYFAGLKGPIRDIVMRSGLKDFLGPHHFYRTPHEAVRAILEEKKENEKDEEHEEKLKEFNKLSDTAR
ncbi:MAG: SulP family inorganic anion transporter [Bacteroidota bacterium]